MDDKGNENIFRALTRTKNHKPEGCTPRLRTIVGASGMALNQGLNYGVNGAATKKDQKR